MAQQTGVLAIADTDPCLPEEKLLELEQKVRLLDPAARALVEELLRVPKAQQEILQERLTSGSEEITWSTIREIASSGGQARYLGAVPSVQATTAKDVPGSQDGQPNMNDVALAMTLKARGQAGVLEDSFGTGWIRLMGDGLIASRN
ncbi:hypothetical protein AK812_SmicGene23697 [Symbiodinium microadriaticum]|uniref:Uncharacterized protein n=1 Tax=Symbiodinium microadriaticum TaxID=2951 RepID=A0A1Q9DGS6_SYMMI|nr:hypothetical protein AK812_SmicGene23697 [Symbiodinium microadriaticum]